MADSEEPTEAAPTNDLKSVRDWIDVIAKSVIALAGLFIAFLANTYQQKASVVTLMNQREAAESSLRSSMMDQLVSPFIGSVQQNKSMDPNDARVLLEILALNFHTHFELKPLFLRVDSDLHQIHEESGRRGLQAIARRLVDRQIEMLEAASTVGSQNAFTRLISKPPAGAKQVNLFFAKVLTLESPDFMLRESSLTSQEDPHVNTSNRPAHFVEGGGQRVCSVSPDSKFAVIIRVTGFDADLTSANVSWMSTPNAGVCTENADTDGGWRQFTLSSYDLPLTDNTQLDPSHRFALNLYYVTTPTDPEELPLQLQIKLVWFPVGYITERERPMNYYEVNRTLGIQ